MKTAQTTHYGRGRGANTPWGKADSRSTYAQGLDFYSTPSHGGFKLSAQRNQYIPRAYRRDDGWYEEDVDAAIVFVWLAVELDLDTELQRKSVKTLKDYYPDEWEAATGNPVAVQASYTLRRRAFKNANAHRLVAVTAWGSGGDVPEGWVKVKATPGGDRSKMGGLFLVPTERYRARGEFGYVIGTGDVYIEAA